ncbi:MAG: hypothetical protein DRR42_08205 [Gammaproteobacteria bacterium]|nr:MAG: hypothetical protein DRR42_08205 [Gammaproteobacteria bacterium]
MTSAMLSGIHRYISEFDHIDVDLMWAKVLNQVVSFRHLRFNWDGEGSNAPSEELINSLLSYLQSLKKNQDLPPPARALATDEGGIVVEWQDSEGVVELETEEPGFGELMFAPNEGETEFKSLDWRPEDVWIGQQFSSGRAFSSTTSTTPTLIYSAA